MYQALYRKWRPNTFDDVVGQEHITTTLKHQVASGKPSHAYLFCGSRGTGKTSCSKILAKAVNCPNQTDGNPCCTCAICKGIDSDSILDVTEIDAASNSGVDNIRELREEANFTPVSTKYRVYIIDETHMLSTGAFNALLKIMEEPPPHVLFILATTEIHKVPATILSRCQRFDFQRIPSTTIANRLLYVAGQEGVTLEEDAAMLMARLSDGGMRDALSLLDLCIAADTPITYAMVQETAGLSDQSYLLHMASAIGQDDFTETMHILSTLWEKSLDPTRFCQQFLGFYRNLLVVKSTTDPTELVEGTPEELEGLQKVAKEYSTERIFYSLTVLSDTLGRISKTAMRRTELEMGLLKLCNPQMSDSTEALLARIEKLERQVKQGMSSNTFAPVQKTETSVIIDESKKMEEPISIEPTLEPEPLLEPEESSDLPAVQPFAMWPDVMEILAHKNKALYGTLVESSAYVVDDLLLVDAGGGLFTQMIRTDDYARESLREAAYSVTGIRYRLGPYQPENYQVREQKQEENLLNDLLNTAQELGVTIEIKE